MTDTCSQCNRPARHGDLCDIHHDGMVECIDCGTDIKDNAGTRPPAECDDCDPYK